MSNFKNFPRDEFDNLIDSIQERIEDVCENREQINLMLIGVVLSLLHSYQFDTEAFAREIVAVHRNALASMDDVEKLLSKFTLKKGDKQ